MRLQEKLALYNTITKISIILVLGAIILFSIDKIAYNHLDNRLIKKSAKLLTSLSDREIDSLLNEQHSFTDYNILKDEFIVLNTIGKNHQSSNKNLFITEKREIEGDVQFYRILIKDFAYKQKWYSLEIGLNMTGIVPLKNTLRLYMLIVLGVAIFITLLTDYAFTKILLKPFYQIIDKKLNQVNDPFGFDYSPTPTTTTDFIFLDNSINSLMKKISGLFMLEKQFIANVSHELLTPISVLNGRLENMLASNGLSVVHEEKITASLRTLSKLKSIINSLLLISKVENEQYVKTDNVAINQILEDIFDDLHERIIDKKIDYQNNTAQSFTFIGNKVLLHILLINIINNAIKYSNIGGSIVISDKLTTSYYQLTITDNGIGMKEETIKRAFNRFERENNDTQEGFGLGLAIANSIARFHDITLNINSEKGKGTIFGIIFPIH